jgi:hypothetical protein
VGKLPAPLLGARHHGSAAMIPTLLPAKTQDVTERPTRRWPIRRGQARQPAQLYRGNVISWPFGPGRWISDRDIR